MNRTEAIEIVKKRTVAIREVKKTLSLDDSKYDEALSVLLAAAEASVAVMPGDKKLRETIEDFLNTFEESGEYDYCIKDILAYFKSFPHVVLPDPEMGARRYDEIYQKLYCEKIRSEWAGSPESLQVIIQEVKTETMSLFLAELLSGQVEERQFIAGRELWAEKDVRHLNARHFSPLSLTPNSAANKFLEIERQVIAENNARPLRERTYDLTIEAWSRFLKWLKESSTPLIVDLW